MKKTVLLLLSITLIFSLVACVTQGGDDSQTTASGQPVTDAQGTPVTDAQGGIVTQPPDTVIIPEPVVTDPPETKRTDVSDGLPEKDYKQTTFNILTQSYDVAANDFIVADQSGDIINDAVYNRNIAIEERFNIRFNMKSEDHQTINTTVTNLVLADSREDSFDLVAQRPSWAALIATKDVYLDWSGIDNIDISRDWWSRDAYDELSIGGKSYILIGDLTQSYIDSMYCVYFNRNLATERGVTDLYEQVRAGKWTYEAFYGIIKDMYDDSNGDSQKNVGDLFGCSLQATGYTLAFQFAFDAKTVSHNADGMPVLTPDEGKWTDMVEKIYTLVYDTQGCLSNTDWVQHRNIFTSGKSLFMPGQFASALRGDFKDMKDTYGIIPMPKYDENQTDYYTYSDLAHSSLVLMKTLRDPEMTGIVTEAMAAESWKYVTPNTFDVALKYKYAQDADQALMVELIRAGIKYDFGTVYSCGPRVSTVVAANGMNSYTSYYKTNYKIWNVSIDKLIEAMKKQ